MSRSVKLFSLLLFVLLVSANTHAGVLTADFFNDADHTEYEFVDYMKWITGDGVLGTDFSDVSSMALSGDYQVAAIGYEAAFDNTFGDASDGTIFQGNNPTGSDGFNSFGEWVTVDMSTAFFRSNGNDPDLYLNPTPNSAIEMYQLVDDVTLQYSDFAALNGFFLPKGTIMIGYNDAWEAGGVSDNHDDLILAAKPVPEPATMLLLGSGLIGLAGFSRRKFKK